MRHTNQTPLTSFVVTVLELMVHTLKEILAVSTEAAASAARDFPADAVTIFSNKDERRRLQTVGSKNITSVQIYYISQDVKSCPIFLNIVRILRNFSYF